MPRASRLPDQPVCPACSTSDTQVLMVAGSSLTNLTYYYCPTPGCPMSRKLPRNTPKTPEENAALKLSNRIERRADKAVRIKPRKPPGK